MVLLQKRKKKTMTASITFFDGFVTKKSDSNCHHFFRWLFSKEGDATNVQIAFFYGGGVVKNVMVVGQPSPSFSFSFSSFWSFWFSSLKLAINNEMAIFFNVEGCNG
jgi:hypothetical protein